MASVVSASALQQLHSRLATPMAVCTSGGGFSGAAREPSAVRMTPASGGRAGARPCGATSTLAAEAPVFAEAMATTRRRPATLYDVLGISDMVSDDEIKAAFRRIAKEVHPDQAPPDRVMEYQRRFMEAHKAYSVLKDPRTRTLYNFEMRNAAFSTPKLRAEDWRRGPSPMWRGCNWETDQCWTC